MKINRLTANALTGIDAPNTLAQPQQTYTPGSYGTQANPLNYFANAAGASGNKTTNADLPDWLKKLGMKGDAYAGGMLKPQLRYGFWFKDGKLNFADGTSFAAKKNKDGSFAYTNAAGQASTYSPTDEQNAYNKAYKASTSDQSFFDKAKNTVGFENFNVKRLWEGVKENPTTLLTGPARTPTSTWVHNTIFGTDLKPLTRQLGGATDDAYAEYGKPTGYAKPLNAAAQAIAAIYGAQGLGNAAGNVFGSAGAGSGGGVSGGAGGGTAGGDLGVFSNGGAGGLANVGVGNAGVLANSGAIGGGAGAIGGGLGGLGSGGGAAAGAGMGWGDWINLGGQLLGSYFQGQGAKDASAAQIAASREGLAEIKRQYDQNRTDQLPWMQAGTAALGRLQDPNAFQASPGYDFVRGEGNRDVQGSFAARGMGQSGNALRALTQYNQGLASQEYNNWFNQQSNLAGLGQTSAQSLGGLGANAANNSANLYNQQGNARASGIAGQTNALTGGISDFLSWYNRRGG